MELIHTRLSEDSKGPLHKGNYAVVLTRLLAPMGSFQASCDLALGGALLFPESLFRGAATSAPGSQHAMRATVNEIKPLQPQSGS